MASSLTNSSTWRAPNTSMLSRRPAWTYSRPSWHATSWRRLPPGCTNWPEPAQRRRPRDSVDRLRPAINTQAMGLRDMYTKRLQKKWDEKSPEEQAAAESKLAER